jgi:GT2 family glycosyltransferase
VDLSIIIVSYNTKVMTIDCIKSIVEQTHLKCYEILVIDNASSDDSVDEIKKLFPFVKVIESNENLGFAAANNLAVKEAIGNYLLLLNPDTLILDQAIDRLYSFARSWKKEAIFGGRTYLGDGTLDPTSCWKKPTLWSVACFAFGFTAIFKRNIFFDPESYGQWMRDSVRNVDIVTGCFLLLKKSTWEKLKGFSPAFFMYAEEADLCLRALKKDIQPVIFPEAKIIHYGGASEKIVSDKMVRMLKAKLTLIRKHWVSQLAIWLGSQFYLMGTFVRAWSPFGLLSPSEKVLQWRDIWRRRHEWAVDDESSH